MAEQGHKLVVCRELVDNYCKVTLHDRIRERLSGSGFENMFDVNCRVSHCRTLMSALFQRFDIESGVFDLGQTKIYFGLEDVLMITGLPIDGKPVIVTEEVTDAECEDLVGVCPGNDKKGILLSALVDFINGFNAESDDKTLNQACRATALLGIGSMVLQEVGTARIHPKFVHLLREVDQIRSYAWGAWKLNPKRAYITGCTFALMIFSFIRMPAIVSRCSKRVIHPTGSTFPLRLEWMRAIGGAPSFDGKNQPSLSLILELLSEQTEETITWKPYKDVNLVEPYSSQKDIGKSVTAAVGMLRTWNHHPYHVHQQLLDRDLDMGPIDVWVNNLPKVPRWGNKIYNPVWGQIWEMRREQLISEIPPTSLPRTPPLSPLPTSPLPTSSPTSLLTSPLQFRTPPLSPPPTSPLPPPSAPPPLPPPLSSSRPPPPPLHDNALNKPLRIMSRTIKHNPRYFNSHITNHRFVGPNVAREEKRKRKLESMAANQAHQSNPGDCDGTTNAEEGTSANQAHESNHSDCDGTTNAEEGIAANQANAEDSSNEVQQQPNPTLPNFYVRRKNIRRV